MMKKFLKAGTCCALLTLLVGCASAPRPSARAELPTKGETPKAEKSPAASTTRAGGYYQDDGPGENPPPNLDAVPDAEPKVEPLHKFANRPYVVLGQTYAPDVSGKPYQARGIASWYGKKFHGQRTSSGEPYDMYGMTAAHPTLPIPSYVRVTNIKNGKSVIVRINDRGPFHSDRVIDLSYTAAYKLGLIQNGSGTVEVSIIDPSNWSPAPPPPESNIAAAPPSGPLPQSYWLQLAAFSVQHNAEQLLTQLKTELGSLGEYLRIQAEAGIYRLRAGPFKSESEAGELAQAVRRLTNLQPVLVH